MKLGKINRQSIGISSFTSVIENIALPPEALYIAGTLPGRRVKTVAIIGSRRPTPYGIEVAHTLAKDLSEQGFVIISGLAYGIDATAHKAALEANGITIAVLANGLHRIYPAGHTALAEQIVRSGGALISEQPLGYDARRYDFLKRNRIISGLADAIVVVEATERSGSLSTIGHALDQNKEVFAVPGPINSLLSAGPNRLIQQGAHIVTSSKDIVAVIAPEITLQQKQLPLGDTELESAIIKAVQSGFVTNEAIVQFLHSYPTQEVLSTLTLMELKGTLRYTGGLIFL